MACGDAAVNSLAASFLAFCFSTFFPANTVSSRPGEGSRENAEISPTGENPPRHPLKSAGL